MAENPEAQSTPQKDEIEPGSIGIDAVSHIFRWDLDKTYLATDFDSLTSLVKIAFEKAKDKENIPGASALLRGLTKYGDGDIPARIYFISGSPRQLRKVLEKKLALDGIAFHKLSLKPNLENLAKGRFRAIKEQVGYKLPLLLRGRVPYGVEIRETLFGDDAESDALIYALYADFMAGHLTWDDVVVVLEACGVYPEALESAQVAAEKIQYADCVEQIFINLDRRSSPTRFAGMHPSIIPVYNYWQAALSLFDKRRLSFAGTLSVMDRMLDRYGYSLPRLQNSTEDLLRRGHLSQEALMRWRAAAQAQDTTQPVRALGAKLERLEAIQMPKPLPSIREIPDYLSLLEQEKVAKRRAKKAAKADKKAKAEFDIYER